MSNTTTVRRELEALECDHEFETYEKEGNLEFQICVVCDQERTVVVEEEEQEEEDWISNHTNHLITYPKEA